MVKSLLSCGVNVVQSPYRGHVLLSHTSAGRPPVCDGTLKGRIYLCTEWGVFCTEEQE